MTLGRICAAGRGVLILVEGTRGKDEHFFNRWFGRHGQSVTFEPAGSCADVAREIDLRRRAAPHQRVYGLVDRDFADDAVVAAQLSSPPLDGIYRGLRYTLENYLLEPSGWFAVARLLSRENPPAGWASEDDVSERVVDAYRQCHAVAAFNRTIHQENQRLPLSGHRYHHYPVETAQLKNQLAAWAKDRDPPQALHAIFDDHLARIAADPSRWPVETSGKAVHKALLGGLRSALGKSIPDEVLCTNYLDKHPTPPADLDAIVQAIL